MPAPASGAPSPSPWRSRTFVRLPTRATTPLQELGWRALLALGLLALVTLVVFLDRRGYVDNTARDGVSLIDALYYATVTITTTGYGDITPVATHARLINALVVTPLRIMFLVLLVGTTLEVLANEGRRGLRDARWRKRMRNHTVIIGYGTKGRSAVETLWRNGVDPDRLLVIDTRKAAITDANRHGLAGLEGDATRRELLRRAEISKARDIVITLDRDDSTILTTLTIRQLNPAARIVVACREHENVQLLRQSGANAVVTSSDAVGRLMALSSVNPYVGDTIDDLLSSGEGLEVAQRPVTSEEAGLSPTAVTGEQVLAVVRNKTLRRFYDPSVARLELGDQIVVARAAPKPAHPVPMRESPQTTSE